VLIGALFMLAAYAFAQAPGGPPPVRGPMGMHGPRGMEEPTGFHGPFHGPMMRRMISERLDRALDRASVTPEQRVKVYEARDRVFAAFEAQRPDPLAMRDRMLAAFEGAQLTQAQLDALHQQADQQRQTIRAAIDRAILDVHATLTPPQRRIVAEYFRNHPMFGGPGGRRFGSGGPDGPDRMGGPGGPRPR
jgi:Spy/CpxP family protein refolding chaperone